MEKISQLYATGIIDLLSISMQDNL